VTEAEVETVLALVLSYWPSTDVDLVRPTYQRVLTGVDAEDAVAAVDRLATEGREFAPGAGTVYASIHDARRQRPDERIMAENRRRREQVEAVPVPVNVRRAGLAEARRILDSTRWADPLRQPDEPR
jgi:hypothetical protein